MDNLEDHILKCERRYGEFFTKFTKLEQEMRLVLFLLSAGSLGLITLVVEMLMRNFK